MFLLSFVSSPDFSYIFNSLLPHSLITSLSCVTYQISVLDDIFHDDDPPGNARCFPQHALWIEGVVVFSNIEFAFDSFELSDASKTTLDEIEHRIIREQFNEPRIHMALVCAAMGCPPLRAEPYLF